MNTKDNLYVNAADICLSMEYWPPNGHVDVHVEVDRPVRMINLDDYAKTVQDDMMEALKEVHLSDDWVKRYAILGEGRSSVIATIEKSSGHELMERYEKWKKENDKKNRIKREQIEAAKKLLIVNGFKVVEEM